MSVSSDDEYAPIEATTWGSQTPLQSNNESEVIETKGWDSLLDPNMKVGPNNVGSGNLHRKGTNFKPIGEDLILAQRLNKPVGKKKMQDAIRETETHLGLPQGKDKKQRSKKKVHLDNNNLNSRKFSHQTTSLTTSRQQKTTHVEVPTTTRIPKLSENSVDGGGSKWLQSSLVDTPFWNEKKVRGFIGSLILYAHTLYIGRRQDDQTFQCYTTTATTTKKYTTSSFFTVRQQC